MSALLQVAAFALGSYLAIRFIAALHGPVDVWHMIGEAWPRVFADVVIWGAAIALIASMMDAPYRAALAWGLLAYLAFYLSLLPLKRLYFATRRADRNVD